MLKLLDENKKQIALLKYVEDYRIESSLKTGNKNLTFYYSKDNEFYDYIKEESYIKTKTDEFIIKARSTEEEETSFICELNLENLEGVPFDRFESIEQPITAALNLAIVGTGWTVKGNNINKKRTVRMTDCSSLDIVQEIIKVYRVDIVFDTLNKQIKVYNELGSDKGTYLIEDLNLKKLGIQSDSYNYATRIKARGKDGLTFASINGGKDYVENYQYTKKIKTIFWSDDRYTIKESLLEDAKEKLNEISKPLVSYAATIKNLALLNPIYKNILDYSLGDIITLISKSNKLKDKQRIVKIIEYPMDHSRDTVELANSTLSFEDLQTEFQDTTDTVNNITTDNGTVDGSTIDGITTKQIEDFEANVIKVTNLKAVYAEIETLKVGKADIQNLNAVTARIGTLESTKANITDLTSTNIKVANLEANKATITELNAASGKISVLESKTASIDNLLAGNLTANNFKTNSIVAGSGIIADGAIGDAQISFLNANKMRAGTLDTSLVTVCGPQGRLKILGNKLQIFDDVNNKLFERIMLGINENNRASLTLRGVDGQTVLLTEEGLTKAGITDGFNKADDNSLNASKFDKNSIVRQVNGATESINGTRVQVGDRSLDVELSTQKNTITNNSKELSSQKATIQALDNSIKLKVDTQTYTNSINAINNNISTTNTNLNKATAELNLLKGEVSSKVSQSEIDKTVNDINNLIKSTNEKIATAESNLIQKTDSIKASLSSLESSTSTKIINAKNEAILDARNIPDTRNNNETPKWYIEHYPRQSITEFKFASIVTIPNSKKYEYGTLETKVPWSDSSGGLPIQIFRSNYYPTYQRKGINDTSWGEWEQIEDTVGSQSKANKALENSKVYTNTQITTVNTRVSNAETSLNLLKGQISTKVSKSDIDKTVTDINGKITNTNEKITNVESTLTQKTNSITQNVTNIQTTTNTLNGKIVNAETRLNSVESKITDSAIINTVRSQFYSKGEADNRYTNKTEMQQLDNKFEWKISTLGSGNLISNSSFNGNFDSWTTHNNPYLSTNTDFLADRYGKMVSIESGGRNGCGIYQRFSTIPGESYTVSFYAEADRQKPLATTIGIEGIQGITLKYEAGWKRWSFTFKATSKQHTFIAYLEEAGKLYLGRVMVTKGTVLQEYREGLGIYSNIVRMDTEGLTVDSNSTNTKTITDSNGFRVQDKRTGENLLEANTKGISTRGGRFYVDGPNGNYTLMWGRDIVINGQRALVGTHNHPEAPLQANKLYVNYNNDFKNGIEIGGKLTNNTFEVVSIKENQLGGEYIYRSMGDGLVYQCGYKEIRIKDGWVIEDVINFPRPFPHYCTKFKASLELVDGNDYWTANYILNSYRIDKLGGKVYGLNQKTYIGSQGSIARVFWEAMGA